MAHKACVDACRYFGGLIVGAVKGASRKELLSQGIDRRGDPGRKTIWSKRSLKSQRAGTNTKNRLKSKAPAMCKIFGSGTLGFFAITLLLRTGV